MIQQRCTNSLCLDSHQEIRIIKWCSTVCDFCGTCHSKCLILDGYDGYEVMTIKGSGSMGLNSVVLVLLTPDSSGSKLSLAP